MLKITLRANERVIVNGCVLRNGDRRQSFAVETHADIIREKDLLGEGDASTPVSRVYYLMQTALLKPDLRDKLVPEIHRRLAELATCFGPEMRAHVLNAANTVSVLDFYKAIVALRPVRTYEAELLALAPVSRAPAGETRQAVRA